MVSRLGRAGMLGSWLLWLLSLPLLGLAMRANEAASVRARWNGLHENGNDIRSLHGAAVLWGLLFVALQLVSPLLLAFTLRAAYRLRTAVCFTIAAGCAMLLDAFGLFGVLVWLRITMGVG